MIIVVDTNIIFSGLLNPNGKIGDLILNSNQTFEFYAPTLILEELSNHKQKLINASKLSENEIDFLQRILFKKIELIDLENISEESWLESIDLVNDIDEFDAPFIALSLELNSPLWTGDKKLIKGLNKKEFDLIFDTSALIKIRNEVNL